LILPSQANPSPLYPVLHLQVKLPSVLSQAAFVSQGEDAHSSISEEKKYTTASDKVYQLLAHGRWFSLGTLASSTTKTGRHGIAEILLKVALKHKKTKIKIK
jgi:hypothetical protein